MILQCPNCSSIHVGTRHDARKACGAAGTIAGVVGGVATGAGRMQLGVALGVAAGPPGMAMGLLLGGLAGGLVGGAGGAALGDLIDQTQLDSLECLRCGHRFSVPSEPPNAD